MRTEFLPFSLPTIGDEEIAEIADSLRSGWLTTGPKAKRFEQSFAEYVGVKHAIGVSSCTAALHTALAALGIGAGDEVIVPTMTFCSTANVVVHLGACPVLVDVGDDFNVQPAAIEAAITERTKAIIPVHFGGQPCDLAPIRSLASRHNIAIVEDAAHAVGAEYCQHKIGASTNPVAFSFYATKNMTTGEGGMITSDDDELADRMRRLSMHGMSKDAWKRYTGTGSWYYEVLEAGYKYNLTDIQAALGLHQLTKLDQFIAVRTAYAQRYADAFSEMPELVAPVIHADRKHAWHLYVLRLNLERLRIDRAAFIDELRARNIGTSVHFIPVHLHPFYRDNYHVRPGQLPNSEALFNQIISLPLYPGMSEADLSDVISSVKTIVEHNRK